MPVGVPAVKKTTRTKHAWPLLARCYSWALWGFLVVILFAQAFGVFWSVVSSEQHALYGEDPIAAGSPGPIASYNDEPYTDRVLACVLQGRHYHPVQLSSVLASTSKSVVVDTSGASVSGYRVCARASGMKFEAAKYKPMCSAIGATLDGIFASCMALGYNVTRDALRVVDDVNSSTTKLVLNSLPVLIMPYWDNTVFSRFAIPGRDGSACVFRLSAGAKELTQYLHAINRTHREDTTAHWLGKQVGSGAWRNGWFEDEDGAKWYSDLISTNRDYVHSSIVQRRFDVTLGGAEEDWRSVNASRLAPSVESWGDSLTMSDVELWYDSVTISNGARFGLFLYESLRLTAVQSQYSLDLFVSNAFLCVLLFQWSVMIVAIQRSVVHPHYPVVGVGCLSTIWNFTFLPIALLPRLKTTLAAFFALGCQFEGDERALAEAWFVVYPAIGELLLFYYSLLNLISKILRRRVSDALFGPTLVFFSLMHLFRFDLAQSGWFEFDGRVTTVISSAEFARLRLTDFFTSDTALRMNGNIKSLFAVKMAVLGLNLTPFLWPSSSIDGTTSRSGQGRTASVNQVEVETALMIRASRVSGLGRPFHYDRAPRLSSKNVLTPESRVLPSYELARIGYLVLADRYLISLKDWLCFLLVSPVRSHQPFANVRVRVFAISKEHDGLWRVHQQPRLVSVSVAEFRDIRCLDISARPLR